MSMLSSEYGDMASRFDVEVYYEDTDLSGFVYHANYFKYFERAREHAIGRSYLQNMLKNGVHFVVSKASVSYLAPARFGETLEVITEGNYSRSPAMEFRHRVYLKGSEQARPLVDAHVTLVILNEQNRPIRMPDDLFLHFSRQSLTSEAVL